MNKSDIGALALAGAVHLIAAAAGKPIKPEDVTTLARKRLCVLVQTRPEVVLLLHGSEERLKREMDELNETWNHWQLRTERRKYQIWQVDGVIE